MKIQGKLTGNVRQFTIKSHAKADGLTALLDVDVGVQEKDAVKKFGADFHLLAFGTMAKRDTAAGDGTEIAFLSDSIKPSKKIKYEQHEVDIDGQQTKLQPEILTIVPVQGDQKVIVQLRLPIHVGKKRTLIGALGASVDEVVDLRFVALGQQDLPLPPKTAEAKA